MNAELMKEYIKFVGRSPIAQLGYENYIMCEIHFHMEEFRTETNFLKIGESTFKANAGQKTHTNFH
jgi:ribonucleotide reductase beta subunit family protein with ferritin-like domain